MEKEPEGKVPFLFYLRAFFVIINDLDIMFWENVEGVEWETANFASYIEFFLCDFINVDPGFFLKTTKPLAALGSEDFRAFIALS